MSSERRTSPMKVTSGSVLMKTSTRASSMIHQLESTVWTSILFWPDQERESLEESQDTVHSAISKRSARKNLSNGLSKSSAAPSSEIH